MKKALALVMALVLLSATLAGCTTLKKDSEGNIDRGAVINMYMTTEVYNFDPQVTINDDAALKIMSLIYEGLTTLDSNGKWQNAMMNSYSESKNDRDGYSITIELRDSKWTDGTTVQAKDFVYSWKRLLDANNRGEAASLLYDIKNARQVNLGNVSIDDLGVSAVDTYTLKITFENENVDLDRFFTNLSALPLVPIREDIVARYGENWAKRAASILTNGPFSVKDATEGKTLRLERSGYYYRDTEKGETLDKYVIPYRLITSYDRGDLQAQLDAYNNDEIFYIGELPLSERANYEKQAEVSDMMVTHTYFFNTQNKLFRKAEVRRALSLALDREKIAEILTFADPAVGYIPDGAFNTTRKTSFRKEGEDLISSSANVEEAKSLLSSAGVRSGSFAITVRDNEADVAVAEYVKSVWDSLGFNVRIEKTGTDHTSVTETEGVITYVVDEYQKKYDEGDFDVIAVDMAMASPDPFGPLSQFAGDFSGNGTNLDAEPYDYKGHVTGYESDEYTALIEKAFASADEKERASLLHDAEALLMQDMPVCPLVFLKSAYLKSGVLSGIKTNYYGITDFKRTKMKNYMDYKETETAAE